MGILANVNINPCKMCMPLGAAIPFKGVKRGMLLLHGSQGCSTYIRRHLSTHYNEPVDIASSSLNEKGTVYGGEENLKKGLSNVIKLYNPRIIGIATTCLAETIGEDINRIVDEFKEETACRDVIFVPVSTPGYGGSQFEGYYQALRRIVEVITVKSPGNGKVNIIAGNLTPADIRKIKELIRDFGIQYTILPDISETLDAPFGEEYSKLPQGGTTVEEIRSMSGASATIEMGMLVEDHLSPGKYLEEEFGVPLYRVPLPIGLENTDLFIEILAQLSKNKPVTSIERARGRMLDGMIDSHKYNSEGRAAIFGDPELILAISQLCKENGIKPLLIATGTRTVQLKNELKGTSWVLDDIDFEIIREQVKRLNVNILIGNSDGKYLTEKEGLPLVRVGFPIHDRVGAQREVFAGYEGSLRLLDKITNTLLAVKQDRYREEMLANYFQDNRWPGLREEGTG
jgi:nitrogenase molybdenum-iron protein NifN